MNLYKDHFQFKGTFRSYQKRVLDRSQTYLKDGKIHIVAAPGSGKTTLGIELLTRLGKPCLILSPSITIREQWGQRIATAFLNENEKIEDWVSSSIKEPKTITTITYQALHSAYTKYSGTLINDTMTLEEEEKVPTSSQKDADIDTLPLEDVDFKNFDLFYTVKKAGIQTLCLDEAHHLRSEWWKALEKLVEQFPDFTIISLTATPPYDSTPAQWQKYTSLCGSIDEEIFTPELVKDKSLCPHQDYVYFNYPTEEEQKALEEFDLKSQECIRTISENRDFTLAISNHKGLKNEKEYTNFFLERPDYFYSLLIFLTEKKIPLSDYSKNLVGKHGTLPVFDASWMEILLQGFLYDDIDSYENCDMLREELLSYLKANHCIVKRKVTLVSNQSLQKMLVSSKGKLNSILTIAESEYQNLGNDLRQLILCDYIKKDCLNYVGKPEITINETGVIPIFELLRRKNLGNLKLGVLCGTIILIPKTATGALDYLLVENDAAATYKNLTDTEYVQVQIKGNNSLVVNLITQLFQMGEIQILIGTKSLLGEGWDSPCINSLILASFVGSFMLSNQMRGRAIRIFKEQPDKISNIWHLLCVEPVAEGKKTKLTSPDYEMLKRRFESFLGVSYTEDVIENGLKRLSIIKEPFTQENVTTINASMLSLAADREALKKRWENALFNQPKTMTIEETLEAAPAYAEATKGLRAKRPLTQTVLSALGFVLSTAIKGILPSFLSPVFGFLQIGTIVSSAINGVKAARMFSSPLLLKQIASALLLTMQKSGQLEEASANVSVRKKPDGSITVVLNSNSTRDKTAFIKALSELLGDVTDPRYLLVRKNQKGPDSFKYLGVPDCLGKKKQDAELLKHFLNKPLGEYQLLYAHTPEGKAALLKARTFCKANSRADSLKRSKQV